MSKLNSIAEYLEAHSNFHDAIQMLRDIMNATELKEDFKWQTPVYYLDGKKIVGIGAFKNHFSIWFYNGVLLRDERQLLVQAQESTKYLRQMRFNNSSEIDVDVIQSYVNEAIENQKSGKKDHGIKR